MSAGGFLFKAGTTFALTADFADQGGSVVSLAGATMSAQLRDVLGNLVAQLTVTADTTVPGRAAIGFAGDTTGWPLSQLRCDVLVSWSETSVQQTETFVVDVIAGVTRPVPPAVPVAQAPPMVTS